MLYLNRKLEGNLLNSDFVLHVQMLYLNNAIIVKFGCSSSSTCTNVVFKWFNPFYSMKFVYVLHVQMLYLNLAQLVII